MSVHERIRDILINHIGKENTITAPEIAELINIESGPSGVNIRDKILEAIILCHLPIATTSKGYYLLPDSEDDLKRYQTSLDGRSHKILYRKFLVTQYFYEYYNREILEFTKEIFEDQTDDDEKEMGNMMQI